MASAVDTVTSAVEPVGQWMLAIGGTGIGIAVVVWVLRFGWDLVRDLAGSGIGSGWTDPVDRAHYDAEEAEFHRRYPSS